MKNLFSVLDSTKEFALKLVLILQHASSRVGKLRPMGHMWPDKLFISVHSTSAISPVSPLGGSTKLHS